MNRYLAWSLVICAFILGSGFGYYLTPDYANLSSNPTHDGLGRADRYLDLRFINGLIAHHQSAIYLLEQVQKNSRRPELLSLAEAVIKLDSKGIRDLYLLKKELYRDPRQVPRFNRIDLGPAEEQFDLRFLNAMIVHHEEAIATSKELLGKSHQRQTLQIASDVLALLGSNLQQLKEWRSQWYGIK